MIVGAAWYVILWALPIISSLILIQAICLFPVIGYFAFSGMGSLFMVPLVGPLLCIKQWVLLTRRISVRQARALQTDRMAPKAAEQDS